MTTLSKLFSTTFIASIAATAVYADPDPAPDISVLVTATRTAQPVERIGSAISALDSVEIERRQYKFLYDALGALPGLSLTQNGSFGGIATVRIRGMRSEHTLVLLDGVEVNDPSGTGGAFDFATLDLNDVERIEVLRGAQSTLYGSDAIGGVVNIITKRGTEDGIHLSGHAEYGAYDTYRAGGTLSGRDERFDFRVSANYVDTAGISKADKRDGNTEKDGYENVTVSANLGYQVTDEFRLEALGRLSDSDVQYDGWSGTSATGIADSDEYSTSKETVLGGRAIVNVMDGKFENIVAVNYSHIDRKNYANDAYSFGAIGKRTVISYQGNYTISDGTILTFGAENEVTSFNTGTEQASINMSSVFGQAQVLLFDNLTVTGGIRYDDHEDYGGHTTLRATAAYDIPETGTVIRGSFGQGFKAPSAYQLTFYCCGMAGPAVDLKPEETESFDVGVEQRFFDDRLKATFTWFYQTTSNMIDYVYPVGYSNVDSARSRGYEIGVYAAPTEWLSVDANYTRLSAIDRVSGLYLARVPRNSGNANVTLRPIPPLSLSVGARYRGAQQDTYGEVSSYVRFDLRAAYRINDRIEVYGRIENLFDKKYQEIYGYGTPGVSAYAGLRGRF